MQGIVGLRTVNGRERRVRTAHADWAADGAQCAPYELHPSYDSVARKEQRVFRGSAAHQFPEYAALLPGYDDGFPLARE